MMQKFIHHLVTALKASVEYNGRTWATAQVVSSERKVAGQQAMAA